jgi:hypothetical protein
VTAGTPPARAARGLLSLATAVSFLLVFHNFGIDILPDRRVEIPAGSIRPYSPDKTFGYVFDFSQSEPDRWPSPRSRVSFFEDGVRYKLRLTHVDEVLLVGGDRFAHEPGRIVFSTVENTDPRTNGHHYWLTTPILYRAGIGDAAMAALLCCTLAWLLICAGQRPVPGLPGCPGWRWHLAGAAALFAFGLYCNTGSLSPYAITCATMYVPQDTGYAYNNDHPHFRVLFDFVDGRDRSVWEHAVFLRRILFPVLGWPLMRLLGFEEGGTLTSLILNVAGFIAAVALLRRWIGERGAVFAAWILALYPGAAYWAGMPYPNALIVPGSLLLMLGLWRIVDTPVGWRLAAISLAMGAVYLGYDLAAFYLPATLLALCWRRRFGAAAASASIQALPLACWLFALRHAFGLSLEDANSAVYANVLQGYLHAADFARSWQEMLRAPGTGFDIFFGANFIFLPALFLFVVAVNPATSRIRFGTAELSVLLSALALFLFLNLAPRDVGGWEMGGTWIARIYQPVMPALVLFMARWWQGLPPLSRPLRNLVLCALALASLGDALIVFGPILDNPGGISETALYRFYDHTDAHFVYESTLRTLGRRPLGFPRAQPAPPTEAELRARARRELENDLATVGALGKAIEGNRAALADNERELLTVGRALAETRSAVLSTQLEIRRRRGEITADEAVRQARPWPEFVPPPVKALMDRSQAGAPGPSAPAEAAAQTIPGAVAAISAETAQLNDLQHAVFLAQTELASEVSELAKTGAELDRAKKEAAALPQN